MKWNETNEIPLSQKISCTKQIYLSEKKIDLGLWSPKVKCNISYNVAKCNLKNILSSSATGVILHSVKVPSDDLCGKLQIETQCWLSEITG